jgi:hypothetical protein
MMSLLIAEATKVTTEEIKKGYGSLIVTGCIFLAAIIIAVWWLRRG